ncbi:hypothetical protein ACKS0A_00967 [Histoplasma ohiense]
MPLVCGVWGNNPTVAASMKVYSNSVFPASSCSLRNDAFWRSRYNAICTGLFEGRWESWIV